MSGILEDFSPRAISVYEGDGQLDSLGEQIMKIEHILVPVDFSDHSFAALKYAIELAREHTSEVVLVHVVEPLPYGIARFYEPTKLLEQYGGGGIR
jgi:universal stress protein family protein